MESTDIRTSQGRQSGSTCVFTFPLDTKCKSVGVGSECVITVPAYVVDVKKKEDDDNTGNSSDDHLNYYRRSLLICLMVPAASRHSPMAHDSRKPGRGRRTGWTMP